jgi:HD-GYP domain-containing protein (c-di-GMP phosphodiesterase class II)
MATATATANEAAGCQQFLPISLATLHPASVTSFALYIQESPELPIRLYRGADYPVDEDDVERLIERGVTHLYIDGSEHEAYQHYLRTNFHTILRDENLPVKRRFGCLNAVVRDVLAELFACGNTTKTVHATRTLAAQTVELICREGVVASELLQVLHHDYHTFTHSANVSYCCVLLARASGISDANELRQIAAGALLHDLGKLSVPEKILKKPGPLSEPEWHIIRQHPATGLKLLAHRADLTRGQLMMVYQHHERLDGSGYPVGVTGKQIHPWAQICAIVDVYEALTSRRPYRPALSPKESIEIIERQAGTRLNRELWQCWKKIIQEN